jgi:2-polyprenyl-3-methyl-5-hydroxy-6-metoxy-1,4-benzoquinol methylase
MDENLDVYGLGSEASFYDDLTPYYHLLFPHWEISIERQSLRLEAITDAHWPDSKRILGAACGIGTQAIGLAQRGYDVTASDLSAHTVERAQREATSRGLSITFSTSDMCKPDRHNSGAFDVVIGAETRCHTC